jgi:invasion protein IalB
MNLVNLAPGRHAADAGAENPSGLSGMIARTALIIIAVIGLTVFANQVQAQDNADTSPIPGQQLVSTGWLKQVAPVPNAEDGTTFNMISYQSRDQAGNVIVEVGIFEVPEQPKRMIIVLPHVPEGHLIPAGIGVRVDENEPNVGQFVFCNQARCQGELEVKDELIAEMKAGENLFVLTRQASDGQAVGIAMSLTGFTSAYDGEGTDAAEMAETQRQYDSQFSEALKRRAEQNRQRLQQQNNN